MDRLFRRQKCKRRSSKAYKSGDLPPYAAADCMGIRKKGNDGIWYKSKMMGVGPSGMAVYRWVPTDRKLRSTRRRTRRRTRRSKGRPRGSRNRRGHRAGRPRSSRTRRRTRRMRSRRRSRAGRPRGSRNRRGHRAGRPRRNRRSRPVPPPIPPRPKFYKSRYKYKLD